MLGPAKIKVNVGTSDFGAVLPAVRKNPHKSPSVSDSTYPDWDIGLSLVAREPLLCSGAHKRDPILKPPIRVNAIVTFL